VDHLKRPLPSDTLDQPIPDEMDQFLTGVNTPDTGKEAEYDLRTSRLARTRSKRQKGDRGNDK